MAIQTNTNQEISNRQPEADDSPLTLVEVLTAEYEHQNRINGWQSPLSESGKSSLEGFYKHLHEQAKETKAEPADNKRPPIKRAAICFSGGGIRSATFALGVLQGLAGRGVRLREFNFLSTVSGGGYIGSWLSAWVYHQGIDGVENALAKSGKPSGANKPKSALSPEPEPIAYLRQYSNYMSPKLGLLSADTWTLVAIFLRNLLLNWSVLLPLLMAILVIPRLGMSVAHWAGASESLFKILFWLGVSCGTLPIAYVIVCRPGSGSKATPGSRQKFLGIWPMPLGDTWFVILCLLPFLAVSVTSAIHWAWIHVSETKLRVNLPGCQNGWCQDVNWFWVFIGFGVLLHLGGFLLSLLCFNESELIGKKSFSARLWAIAGSIKSKLLRGLDVFYIAITGAAGGACLWFVAKKVFTFPPVAIGQHKFYEGMALFGGPSAVVAGGYLDSLTLNAAIYVCFATPLFMLVLLLAATMYTGLASDFMTDADREWLARSGAWILIAITVWSVVGSLVVFGPWLLLKYGPMVKGSFFSIGTLTGLLTLLGGWSGKTAASKQASGHKPSQTESLIQALLPFAAPLFAGFILVSLSLATSWIFRFILEKLAAGSELINLAIKALTGNYWLLKLGTFDANYLPEYEQFPLVGNWHLNVLYHTPTHLVALVAIVLMAFGGIAGRFINVNKFSLHGAYRDRLIRAYLGASRTNGKRRSDPFTSFDEDDNLRMFWLRESKVSPSLPHPLHVINTALNLAAGDNLAWQDRKAESFTFSPLHAGSRLVGYRPTKDYACDRTGTSPISLGTCLAISGAAASPNMGYHSSPVVTFLLALFNVRLGWWLGNPRKERFNRSSPRFAPIHLLAETFGRTDAEHKYVYLSDGGHFENLGLYEMVRRRCHLIVVSDASADCDFSFEDLGGAIRKIQIDQGVPIEFGDRLKIRPRVETKLLFTKDGRVDDGQYCSVARINYKAVDGDTAENGWLLYIKPTVYGSEAPDVLNYAKDNPTFPHETTGDQMYSESQFESYRSLGETAVEKVIGNNDVKDLADLFDCVKKNFGIEDKPPINHEAMNGVEGDTG
ncbi:MAG: hypothetical protein AAB401_05955 [Acidobacteriota bacterium]